MRWFWGLVLLAAIVAGVLLLAGRPSARPPVSPTPAPAPVVTPASPGSRPPAEPSSPRPTPAPPLSPETTSAESPTPGGEVRPLPVPTPDAGLSPLPVDPAASIPADPATPAPSPARGAAPDPLLIAKSNAAANEIQATLDEVLGISPDGYAPPRAPEPVIPLPPPGSPPADPNAKAKLVQRADGATLVDDRFIIKGTGSESDPFVVSWEMLVSAQETYQPRLGRKIIPDRVQMLHDKWVRISGFIAFPLMAQSQDEMLMMLNQWDGCCIGVPPTPYDAIEVKLKVATEGDDRLRVSGGIKGILRVDPYLVKDWLVSLYLMDDGELLIDRGAPKRDPSAMGDHIAR